MPAEPLAVGEVGHREDTTVARHHGRDRLVEHAIHLVMRRDRFAGHGAEEFAAVAHHFVGARRLDRIGIGPVHPFEPAIGGAQPERHVQRVEQAEHGVMVGGEPLVFQLQPGLRAQILRQAGEADNDMRAGLAALDLQWQAGIGFDRQVERHSPLAQGR